MNRVHHDSAASRGSSNSLLVWAAAALSIALALGGIYVAMSTPSTHSAALLPSAMSR
jgi:hypothetical protein